MSMPMRWEQPVAPPMPSTEGQLRRRRAPRRKSRLRLLSVLVIRISIFLLAVVGALSLLRGAKAMNPETLRPATPANGQVALGSASVERRLGFVTVTGNAVSRVAQPLSRVEAVVELLDAQRKTVQMESALIAFDTLPAHETAPFRVVLPDNSRAISYRVRFKQLLGAALN